MSLDFRSPPVLAAIVVVVLTLVVLLQPKKQGSNRVNREIGLEKPKVVDTINIEDIGDKAVLCRCWKSETFPYCSGAHNKHNEECGDNVGPLIIKRGD